MAASYLRDAIGPGYRALDLPCRSAAPEAAWKLLDQVIAKGAIMTSSCGRLFDAVSAICGISGESSYEGESAMLLEAAAQEEGDEQYEVVLRRDTVPWTIDTRAMISRIAQDVSSGRSPRAVSRGFHNAMAVTIASVCGAIRERNGLDKVCLSGGSFQNFTLLAQAVTLLRKDGFEVFLHSLVPPNDGGLSLGQAVIAANFLERI
jgi:hydrogenase maturation protein HypF